MQGSQVRRLEEVRVNRHDPLAERGKPELCPQEWSEMVATDNMTKMVKNGHGYAIGSDKSDRSCLTLVPAKR